MCHILLRSSLPESLVFTAAWAALRCRYPYTAWLCKPGGVGVTVTKSHTVFVCLKADLAFLNTYHTDTDTPADL